jgi:hypothetical protein
MVCEGDKNKNFGKKKRILVRRVKMVCNGDKKFGQKNPCKLEELRWFVMVIKIKILVKKTHLS